MTDYAPTTFVDSSTPAINETNLNHLEGGIEDAYDELTVAELPIGVAIPYAGATAPTGWLFADGLAISRTTYADYFDLVGEMWGEGDNATTFNLPDLRDRTPAGASASRPSGSVGGSASHQHETSDAGGHGHSATPGGSTGSVQATTSGGGVVSTDGHSHGGGSLSGGSHEHLTSASDPPYQASPYIVKVFAF